MITHIVLLKVAPDTENNELNQLMDSLGGLRYSTIPQIQEFSYGENNSPESLNRGYTHGFILRFLSKEDRDYYLDHPDHVKVAEQLLKLLVDGVNSVCVFDS